MLTIDPRARGALARLRQSGFAACLVGGCVRNLSMGRAPHDWDIATSARPEETARTFANRHVIETGLQHGTVTVLVDGLPLEITTFRAEGAYSDHRRPDSVRFITDLRGDLARRDFTVNAMAVGEDGGVIDPFGGLDDLHAGIIRCVGQARARFGEDALRILRALRFAATLGFTIEPGTADAMRAQSGLLRGVSAERVFAECTKLICGESAGKVLSGYGDILAVPLPELTPLFGFAQHNAHHTLDVWRHTVAAVEHSPACPVSRWAALLHDIGKPGCFSLDANGIGHFYGHAAASARLADTLLRRLRCDNAARARITLLVARHDAPANMREAGVRRFLGQHGEDAFLQLLALARADNLAQAPAYRTRQKDLDRLELTAERLLAARACLSRAGLAVDGRDALACNLRGAQIGRALASLLNEVLENRLPNARAPLLATLQDAAKRENGTAALTPDKTAPKTDRTQTPSR